MVEFNQQFSLGNLCDSYTEYQQVLTNYTSLNNTYQELIKLQTFGGLGACIEWMNNYTTCNKNYTILLDKYNICSNTDTMEYAYSNYTKCNTDYNTTPKNLNSICNTVIYCSGGQLGQPANNQQYGYVSQCCASINYIGLGPNYGCGDSLNNGSSLANLCRNLN